MKHSITTLLFSLTLMIQIDAATWEALPPLPEPNGGFVCGILNGGIVIAGGTKWVDGTKVWLDKIWWLDPATLKWSPKGNLPLPVAYSVCGKWRDGVIIAGGFDGTKARDEVWHLTSSFELKTVAHLKTAVSIAQGGVCNDDLIVVGGTPDVAKLDALVATAQHISLTDGVAKEITAPNETPFGVAASSVIGSHLYLHGGARHDAVKAVANLRNARAFDAGTKRWQALAPHPVATRGAGAEALDDHRIYVAGGYADDVDDFTDKAFICDVKANAYIKSIPLPMPNCASLIVCDGHLYVLGGEPAKKVRTDKCWLLPVAELLR